MRAGDGDMSRAGLAAVVAAMLLALSPARAGEWQYHPATDLVFYGSVPVARWYGQRPSMRAGTRHNYRRAYYVPRCPHPLCGHPLPIYKTPRPLPGLAVRGAVIRVHRARPAAHVAWCAARYRSYDAPTDTFQPYHGPRRHCRSPYR
ncbi:MAG: BA14K family protein [Rhizobiaceae bacterium]|nr:BA14K family protein [Rhizobiaceae bacterium]MCV0405264.1 BA14K family protein [Rhizobiaceae bacterium]